MTWFGSYNNCCFGSLVFGNLIEDVGPNIEICLRFDVEVLFAEYLSKGEPAVNFF